jgi:hypothetical protein
MAQPLTSFQEPGFFSQITESPSLFLLPGSVRVVGLVGTGKATKSVLQESATRVDTSTNHSEALANDIVSITRVYSNSVFQFPTSSYSSSITGSVNLTTITLGDLTGKTFIVKRNDGAAMSKTFTVPASVADIAVQINTVLTGAKAYINAANKLCIISGDGVTGDGGAKLQVTTGSSNTILGFVNNTVGSEINWKPSFASSDANVRPLDGQEYLVDYERAKVAADLKPQSFFSLSQVSAEYGDPSNDNKLSLGAQGAFAGGASIVTCRQLDPNYVDLGAEMTAALVDMEAQDVNYLVPMEADTTLWGKYLTHVSKMSSKLERKERRAILGVDEMAGRIALTGGGSWTELMATFTPGSGLEPKRIQVVNPGYCLVTVKSAQILTDGTYAAAVLAGTMASPVVDTATPMTRKSLASIDSLMFPDLLRSEKNYLTSIGVTVLEHKGAVVVVRRSVTADASSVASQEPSIVDSMDQVAREVREALENRFVGTKITGGTQASVEAATNTFLLRFVADELIASFRNVQAVKNSVEPRQFDVSAEVLPIFPFLWGSLDITIVIS